MKEAIGNHRTGLPPHLLHLFQGRPAPPYLDPLRKKTPTRPLTGVAAYTEHFEVPEMQPEQEQQEQPAVAAPPPPTEEAGEEGEEAAAPAPPTSNEPPPKIFLNPEYALQVRLDKPTRLERLVTRKKNAIQRHKEHLEPAVAAYNPSEDPNIEGDPLKTLFVARLAPDALSERKLRREFEEYGPIKRITIIHDKKTGTPRGYAFIEYEDKDDMKEAYKCTDGMRIEGKRVVVDVERGRTVPGWLPRRLGGGRGGEARATRLPKDPVKKRIVEVANKLAGVEEEEHQHGAGMAAMDEDRERDRDGGGRHRERERDSYRSRDRERDRGDRDRDRDGGRRRDTRRDRNRDRDRDRDDYGRRERDRDSRKRERGGGGGGGYDDYDYGVDMRGSGRDYGGEAYNTVPPPGSITTMPMYPMGGGGVVPAGAVVDDEPEEGEFVEGVEEGERDAKRPREY